MDHHTPFEIVAQQDGQMQQEGPARTSRTSRYLTKFEKIKVLQTRATQLKNNATPWVTIDKGLSDPMEVAMKELREKKIRVSIRRFLPDGTFEDHRVDELDLPLIER